jgi:hypothetical protein
LELFVQKCYKYVDSKATLEDFLTLKKRLNLYSFYGNVMKKSVVTRMSLRSDKDVETYLLKSRSDDNETINLLKTARKTFATGNAIYPLPRTIIQIMNDNSIFRKEGITAGLC